MKLKTIITPKGAPYSARANQGAWVQLAEPPVADEKALRGATYTPVYRGGCTVAMVYEEWTSDYYRDQWHGIDVTLDAHASGGLVLDCNVTYRDLHRTAVRYTEWLRGDDAIERAKAITESWLDSVHEGPAKAWRESRKSCVVVVSS